jgi:hypothetical protein
LYGVPEAAAYYHKEDSRQDTASAKGNVPRRVSGRKDAVEGAVEAGVVENGGPKNGRRTAQNHHGNDHDTSGKAEEQEEIEEADNDGETHNPKQQWPGVPNAICPE